MEKRPSIVVALSLVLVVWAMVTPLTPLTLACPSDGSGCKECIAKQLKCGCPECGPALRCMARCLWGGSAKADCAKRCDCGGGGDRRPKLATCKKCMSKCKCSCMVY